MIEFTPISALIGGAILGTAAVLLLLFNGRIAGISGILTGVFTMKAEERIWRALFVIGLIAGGFIYQLVSGESLITREGFSVWQLILAGLLVGFGTRIGSGCTSGHGVCGIARLSPRSLISTMVFLGTGMATATLIFLAIGGATS